MVQSRSYTVTSQKLECLLERRVEYADSHEKQMDRQTNAADIVGERLRMHRSCVHKQHDLLFQFYSRRAVEVALLGLRHAIILLSPDCAISSVSTWSVAR